MQPKLKVGLFLSFSLLLLFSCHKKEKEILKQYSMWIVNCRDTFVTNNVDSSVDCNPDHSFCHAGIRSHDPANKFRLGFYSDHFPQGDWLLSNLISEDPNYAYLSFYYNNQFYIVSATGRDTLYANFVNGSVCYKLHPTWYLNYNNHSDSIQIQGTFNTP